MNLVCTDECELRHSVVSLHGEIDLDSADDFLREAVGAMADIAPTMTVDLSGVTFMDCSGINLLLAMRSETISRRGHVNVVGGSASTALLLGFFGIQELFDNGALGLGHLPRVGASRATERRWRA